ncbi:uncharacterized protein N0V89_005864 [Didymosphaeria variabile]|uniref:Saccharopine dehydrogenase NADP binding domain-containing protein n=1 Tax=Didymosphaeria variabile TaxID=1932322 RepID=A0A9W8XM64_9PLEO|nr:uncharacterized protein N0V89_005864 [Didymosphaeria variabile]KAJ4354131.1 hypothetical protein N0V89_005864 [Didymosphaeria variabile]
MADTKPREYDLVLYGATGYTGGLTAQYITKHLPSDLHWAIAGRSPSKLNALSSTLTPLRPDRPPPSTETIEHTKDALVALARKTRVLITTVGPFHLHGSLVMEVCATAGTHYVDSTGETPWVYEVAHKCHELAKSNGACLITQCAMDSAPADLAAYALVRFLRENCVAETKEVVHSIQEWRNGMSGGTLHSLIGVAGSYPFTHLKESIKPLALCLDGVHPKNRPRAFGWSGTKRQDDVGLLTDSVIGIPDAGLVYRSWSLMDYGEGFSYFTGMKAANRVSGFFWHAGLIASLPMLLVSPIRKLLTSVLPSPGEGPSENEAAIVLLRPDRENWAQRLGGGVLTPATLGDQYVERVKTAGLKMDIGFVGQC